MHKQYIANKIIVESSMSLSTCCDNPCIIYITNLCTQMYQINDATKLEKTTGKGQDTYVQKNKHPRLSVIGYRNKAARIGTPKSGPGLLLPYLMIYLYLSTTAFCGVIFVSICREILVLLLRTYPSKLLRLTIGSEEYVFQISRLLLVCSVILFDTAGRYLLMRKGAHSYKNITHFKSLFVNE